MQFFQPLNNAKTIWDSRSEPKGITLGHFNFRSIVNKTEQMEHLLSDSNIDILGVIERHIHHLQQPSVFPDIMYLENTEKQDEVGVCWKV